MLKCVFNRVLPVNSWVRATAKIKPINQKKLRRTSRKESDRFRVARMRYSYVKGFDLTHTAAVYEPEVKCNSE